MHAAVVTSREALREWDGGGRPGTCRDWEQADRLMRLICRNKIAFDKPSLDHERRAVMTPDVCTECQYSYLQNDSCDMVQCMLHARSGLGSYRAALKLGTVRSGRDA